MSPAPVPSAPDRPGAREPAVHWWRLRPVRPEDLAAIEALLDGLDDRDRYRRWFTAAVNLHRAALWATHPERQGGVGLVADAGGRVVGHGALAPIDARRAEVAFEVAADWRHHGIAGRILQELDRAAASRGVEVLEADVLPGNRDMLLVFREHGPCTTTTQDGVVHVVMPVQAGRGLLTTGR
jgi:RimJ/RimL family protein N-acetyltransferase